MAMLTAFNSIQYWPLLKQRW